MLSCYNAVLTYYFLAPQQLLSLVQLEPNMTGMPHELKFTWGERAIKRDLSRYGEEELRFYFL